MLIGCLGDFPKIQVGNRGIEFERCTRGPLLSDEKRTKLIELFMRAIVPAVISRRTWEAVCQAARTSLYSTEQSIDVDVAGRRSGKGRRHDGGNLDELDRLPKGGAKTKSSKFGDSRQ
jgi:hypothetical protein